MGEVEIFDVWSYTKYIACIYVYVCIYVSMYFVGFYGEKYVKYTWIYCLPWKRMSPGKKYVEEGCDVMPLRPT